MEKLNNLIIVMGSAVLNGCGVGKYEYLGYINKYTISPDLFNEGVFLVSNQKELKKFNIKTKDILQVLLKFINEGYKIKD